MATHDIFKIHHFHVTLSHIIFGLDITPLSNDVSDNSLTKCNRKWVNTSSILLLLALSCCCYKFLYVERKSYQHITLINRVLIIHYETEQHTSKYCPQGTEPNTNRPLVSELTWHRNLHPSGTGKSFSTDVSQPDATCKNFEKYKRQN